MQTIAFPLQDLELFYDGICKALIVFQGISATIEGMHEEEVTETRARRNRTVPRCPDSMSQQLSADYKLHETREPS